MLILPMRFCLAALLLCPAGAGAGEAETRLPVAVQALVDRATQEVAKERTKYDAAAKKVTDKLAADLKKEMEKATRAGNLELALAVQAQIAEVASGTIVATVDEMGRDGDLLGDGPGVRLPPGEYTITAKCDDFAEVYVNAKCVIQRASAEAASATITVTGALIVMVKCTDTGGGKGFSCTITNRQGQVVRSTSTAEQWRSFQPGEQGEWHATRLAQARLSKVTAASNQGWTVEGAAAIWGDPNAQTCHLVLVK